MSILSKINISTVCTPLKATNKTSVLRELVAVLKDAGLVRNLDAVYLAVHNREQLGSTGLGDEIAIPHAKTDAVDDVAIAVGIAPHGIDFDSLDDKPVKIFFLILANPEHAATHIEALSEIAKLAKNKAFCQSLIEAKNNNELAEAFNPQ
ncbi:MAG: PTS sugar transporter subunit IIA [Spirochaetia bacterium]